MCKALLIALGLILVNTTQASNFPIKCIKCGKLMKPGGWHRCETDNQHNHKEISFKAVKS